MSRSLKIALYMNDMSGGGVERVKIQLLSAFRRRGHDVTMLLHSERGELAALIPPDVKKRVFNTSRTLYDFWPLVRFLRAQRPDILISSLDHNNVMATLACLASMTHTRVIICQHNALSAEARLLGWKYQIIPAIYRVLSPALAGIVAVSKGVADDLSICCGIRRDRVTVIYNPVINEEFYARAAEPCSHPWLSQNTEPVFVTAGRLVDQKDHQMLLDAFASYRAERPGRLLILGTGPNEQQLKARARALSIESDVEFMGFQHNPLPYIREADAFLLSSQHEGLGNVLIEALGCGTPVISTDCPHGPNEILMGGKYGELVAVGDSAAMALHMTNESWRLHNGAEMAQAISRFGIDAIATQYLDLITTAIG